MRSGRIHIHIIGMVILGSGMLACSLTSLGGFSSGSNGTPPADDASATTDSSIAEASSSSEASSSLPEGGGVCAQGLVGRWSFDVGTINGNVVSDISGAGRNGTLSGDNGPPPMSAEGKFGNGLQFQTNPSRVTVPNVALDTNANAKNTVSLWFFRAGPGDVDDVLFDMPTDPRYDLWYTQQGTTEFLCINTREFDCWGIEASTISGGLRNRWVHVAVILNNGPTIQSSLYVDGVKRTPTCHTNAGFNDCSHSRTVANPVVLSSGDFPYRGRIDDVRIYSRGLNDAEIKSIYDGACQ